MAKVLITTSNFGAVDKKPLDKLEKEGFEVINNPYHRKVTVEELRKLLPDIVGLIAGLETINKETMKNSKLKVISRVGVGVDSVDLEAAKELGIFVKNTPDAPTVAVAELTLGAMISLLRHISNMDKDLHKKVWDKKTGIQLSEKKVLIIGFGRIGRYLAKLLKPFNVELMAADKALSGEVDGVRIVSLKEALPEADIICLHLSGNSQVLGKEEFLTMKKGVFILNAARGGVIDEKVLEESIKDGKVAGVWLDVFLEEPYFGSLINYPQVLLTPHVGSNTKECKKKMEMEAVDNLISVLKNE
ncbi:MAG: phosphoglycerate dehydrogenase [Candidatus Nealsonbacteria bacterium]